DIGHWDLCARRRESSVRSWRHAFCGCRRDASLRRVQRGLRHLGAVLRAAKDMTTPSLPDGLKKQHVIDPEICIRCNTCEATCPVGAVTHNDANYVVDPEKCNYCMDCISPCPTGSIDNWRIVRVKAAYSLDEQMEWTEHPTQEELGDSVRAASLADASEAEIAALIAAAHHGAGGKAVPRPSASKPAITLFTRAKPAVATMQGTFRITDPHAESDVRHIVLSFD